MDQMLEQIKENLKGKISDLNYNTWFKPIQRGSLADGVFTLFVPNRFVADWITDYYADLVEKEVRGISSQEVQLRFQVEEVAELPAEEVSASAAVTPPALSTVVAEEPRTAEHVAANHFLNPKYSFETFVVGSGNQLAHAAARAVAELPGRHYNPLFLYGGVGLGKTHLLNAIGLEIYRRHPDFKIIYISSERFMNELIHGIRYERMGEFRKKYRSNCDILLVDDIQFIAGKERTQDEFFHTFNTLYEHQRQIIVTSDKFPKEIPGLEDRLRSRFEWGLIADIQAPDLETRIAILKKKAETSRIRLSNEVVMFMATQLKGNVRELEGALIRLHAFADLAKAPITLELTKEVLHNVYHQKIESHHSIEFVQKLVADFYQIKTADLKSHCRTKGLSHPRHVAMYLCRKHLHRSFPEIGAGFGGKDHTTVMHAVKKIEQVLLQDEKIRNDIEYLEKALHI